MTIQQVGLSEAQTEKLRQMLQPLVHQYKVSQAAVLGYLMGAGISCTGFNVDISTGTVTLQIPPGATLKKNGTGPLPDSEVPNG